MSKINVTFILADQVKEELNRLDKAEAERDPRIRAKAVAVAKKQIRESPNVQAIPDRGSTRGISSEDLAIYGKYLALQA